ncbi:MAG: glycosyltransferase [bacterium]|nr:glycosyltransferase [bacterium]
MPALDDYAPIVGTAVLDDLRLLADRLRGRVVQFVNSTAVGGGVAEILNRMVPLLRDLGVDARWDVIKGGDRFFNVTKKIHNALHGKVEEFGEEDVEAFMETSRRNIAELETYGDVVFIHDPQPIALVEKKAHDRWIWRCHVDVSAPDRRVWEFLEGFITRYDAAVFSAPSFSQRLPIRQFLVAPSIDPLSDKNRDLPQETVDAILARLGVPTDKPLITQISRFDRLKDPVGVIEAYRRVKKYIDCRLLLAGGTAADDPEGIEVFAEVKARAAEDPDIIILLMPHDDLAVNAIQRASTIILQKSLKEGFGLTVSEALWKGKPVVASHVGGIPLQIKHKYSGLLCHSVDGAAFLIKQLLNSPSYAKRLGENGREQVRNNFLLTRHLKDYLLLFLSLFHRGDMVYL